MLSSYPLLKIVLIEDNINDVISLHESLVEINSDYEIYHFPSLAQARVFIDQNEVDVVIVDINLSDCYGIHTLEELFSEYYQIPFILLTGLNDEIFALEAVKKGAQDFLVKGEASQLLLSRSITYSIQRKELEKKALSNTLEAEDKVSERIARDVHDSLGQSLTSTSLNLQKLKSKLDGLDINILKYLDYSINSIHQAIQETRGIARSLMPKTLKEFGLDIAIKSLLSQVNGASSIDIQFLSSTSEARFNKNVELVFYRILQESLNNTLKYSEATELFIELECLENQLLMRINDDGKGFDVDKMKDIEGVGFESMRNRAKSIGAKLIIFSIPNEGTSLSLTAKIKKFEKNTDIVS